MTDQENVYGNKFERLEAEITDVLWPSLRRCMTLMEDRIEEIIEEVGEESPAEAAKMVQEISWLYGQINAVNTDIEMMWLIDDDIRTGVSFGGE